jgi:hypothetical protein
MLITCLMNETMNDMQAQAMHTNTVSLPRTPIEASSAAASQLRTPRLHFVSRTLWQATQISALAATAIYLSHISRLRDVMLSFKVRTPLEQL